MKYRREIDGLRAIALIPVVCSHAEFNLFKGTFIMIDVFFVVSGYLITALLIREKTAGTFSAMGFYERRARRLLPALFFMMLLSIPFAWLWIIPSHFKFFCKSLMAVPVFSSNFLFWSETNYFNPANKLKPFLQTWSLAVEEQFYLFFPLIFHLAWPKGRTILATVLIVISVISLGCMQWGLMNDPSTNWFLLPGRAWEFVLGALIALYPGETQEQSRKAKLIKEFCSFAGLLTLLFSVFNFKYYKPFPSFYTLLPILATCLIIRFADSKTLIGKVLGTKPFVGIGLISYGVFVWHQPLFAMARHFYLEPIEPYKYGILILLSFLFALISWRFIEQPFRNVRFLKRKTFVGISVLVSIAFMVFGYLGLVNSGYPDRFALKEGEIFRYPRMALTSYYSGPNDAPLEPFLQNWIKNSEKVASHKLIPIAVFGDSLSADIARSLQARGLILLHMGGAACSENPMEMDKTNFCRNLFDVFINRVIKDDSIKYIAIAQRAYLDGHLSVESVKKKISLWKKFGKNLIIFSDLPHFPFLKERLIRGKTPIADFYYAKLSTKKELADLLIRENVMLVNSLEIYCSFSQPCGVKKEETGPLTPSNILFVTDYHLSEQGILDFGERLIARYPVFKETKTVIGTK